MRPGLVLHRIAVGESPALIDTAAQQQLAGSPAPLAALHDQASQLLGSEPALQAGPIPMIPQAMPGRSWDSIR